jgi:hypothetical protein
LGAVTKKELNYDEGEEIQDNNEDIVDAHGEGSMEFIHSKYNWFRSRGHIIVESSSIKQNWYLKQISRADGAQIMQRWKNTQNNVWKTLLQEGTPTINTLLILIISHPAPV